MAMQTFTLRGSVVTDGAPVFHQLRRHEDDERRTEDVRTLSIVTILPPNASSTISPLLVPTVARACTSQARCRPRARP